MNIKIFILYYFILSVISIILTVYDKTAAKIAKKNRVRESTLLLFGFLGGAFSMYITMLLIRHKTLKTKFMISLPILSFIHVALFIISYYKLQII